MSLRRALNRGPVAQVHPRRRSLKYLRAPKHLFSLFHETRTCSNTYLGPKTAKWRGASLKICLQCGPKTKTARAKLGNRPGKTHPLHTWHTHRIEATTYSAPISSTPYFLSRCFGLRLEWHDVCGMWIHLKGVHLSSLTFDLSERWRFRVGFSRFIFVSFDLIYISWWERESFQFDRGCCFPIGF